MSGFNPERWERLWRLATNQPPPPESFAQLAARYAEPQRHYHGQRHLADCLAEFDAIRTRVARPVAVELALWFHDAVYDPRAPDNEERSAQLAVDWLLAAGAEAALTERVRQLVLATKKHDVAGDEDAPWLLDVDLSILGQVPERFWEYERQIREEYAWVPQPAFAAGRAGILRGFLARPHIYQTDGFRERLEGPARRNLQASIRRLEGQDRT